MSKITYEPIINEDFPFTAEDLRNLYIKLAPLFHDDDRLVKVIQVENN